MQKMGNVTQDRESGILPHVRQASDVRLEIDAGVAVVTIDRPEARNAIGFATIDALGAAVDEVADSGAAVLVLRGGGDRAFVSGGDIKELGSIRTHDAAVAMARRVRTLLDRVAAFPVPVIAALNGHALGGGAEVAVAADIRIAADDIRIGFNQVTLGIMPAWGGAERLAQLVGRSRALLAIATGELYDAASAQSLGLVDLVVPRASFDDEWRTLAHRLATSAPGTTRAVKGVVGAAVPSFHPELEADATDAFARLWTGDAHWAAVEALDAKRRTG
jgi:enoyl-CoA hydratase